MSVPVLAKNARLIKGSSEIGYCKNISAKGSAEMIKDYSMDSFSVAIICNCGFTSDQEKVKASFGKKNFYNCLKTLP